MAANPPDDSEQAQLALIAHDIQQRGWQKGVAVVLEAAKPLGFILAQLLWMADPLLGPFVGQSSQRYAWLLEDPKRIDALCQALAHK